MSTAAEKANTDAQRDLEAERAARQERHLSECTEKDCRFCKLLRGEPLNDPPTPRCPLCNAYGYEGPAAGSLTVRLAERLVVHLAARHSWEHYDRQGKDADWMKCDLCAFDLALLREAGAIP